MVGNLVKTHDTVGAVNVRMINAMRSFHKQTAAHLPESRKLLFL